MELARQYVRDNNGRLLCSMAYLKPRGWGSNDVITRAVRELMTTGLVHQTVQGCRPNKASWFAITWRGLDRHPGYDAGAIEGFQRGAYRQTQCPAPPDGVGNRGAGKALPTPSGGAVKITPLTPSGGVEMDSIAPSRGAGKALPTPSGGAIEGGFALSPTPSGGDHLEEPSAGSSGARGAGAGDGAATTPEPDVAVPAQPIATLAELWERVGCRSTWRTIRAVPAAAASVRSARRLPKSKTASRADRIAAGRQAMQEATARGHAGRVDEPAASVQEDGGADVWLREREAEPPWADW